MLKQSNSSPLFPDMLWSQPETKHLAGNLLVIGGNKHGFSDVVKAYNATLKAGIGHQQVAMPSTLKNVAGPLLDNVIFTASTPSGSFARESLAELLDCAQRQDGTLLAGNFGRNSETGILLESFASKNTGLSVFTRDAADYYVQFAHNLEDRSSHVLAITFAQLQKLAINLKWPSAFVFSINLLQLADNMQAFCKKYGLIIITKFHKQIIASNGVEVLVHTLQDDLDSWRTDIAASASVWLVQNPTMPIGAIACSLIATRN